MNLTWCYNERHFGKGSMDEDGQAMKSTIYRNVMSGKYVIDAPKEFPEYTDRTIKGTTSIGGIK